MFRALPILLLAVGVGCTGWLVLASRAYHRSGDWIADLEASIAEMSGLEVEIDGVAWDARSFVVDRISLAAGSGATGARMRGMQLEGVSGTVPLGAWLQRAQRVEGLRIVAGSIELKPSRNPAGDAEKSRVVAGDADSGSLAVGGDWGCFISGPVAVQGLGIDFGGGLSLAECALVVRQTKGRGALHCSVRGGLLSVPLLPALRLGGGNALLSGGRLEINSHRIGFEGEGEAKVPDLMTSEMTGEIDVRGGTVDLRFDLWDEELGEMLAGEWRRRLSGRFGGSLSYTGDPGAGADNLVGRFVVQEAHYRCHPALQLVAQLTGDEALGEIWFESGISGRLALARSGGRIEELEVDQRGVLSLRGDLAWQRAGDSPSAASLQGKLLLGILPETVARLPGGRPSFFRAAGEHHFSCSEVQLAGSLERLSDSLLPRLARLVPEVPLSQP